ncbi:MAG: D-aminopeptidase [Cyclobacteriaceae bacterium]|nr:MAG: D-aminopeptidase [Cyclobacteriaceae bacterium]
MPIPCRCLFVCAWLVFCANSLAQSRLREAGVRFGVLPTGRWNAITDVTGVRVGHCTLTEGTDVRTGVTVVVPHQGNLFQEKVPAAIFTGNGFGKLAGYTQVEELGNLETPVVLTNTLSVPVAVEALIEYTLSAPGNEAVQSVNAVVGETNDGFLNDIRGLHVKKHHVIEAIAKAASGPVQEGNVGAGTGTVCLGYKGGIGTASRVLPERLGGYTVGVLVQTNFGGILTIDGVPVGEELGNFYLSKELGSTADGSCMIVVATNAPLDARNLKRLAQRALFGLARTGGIAANGSGDYVIAFSTHQKVRVWHNRSEAVDTLTLLRNDNLSPLFLAVIEATEEAIVNSLWAARTMKGKMGRVAEALPQEKVLEILRRYGALHDKPESNRKK